MSKLWWLVNLHSGGGAGRRVLTALRPLCGADLAVAALDLDDGERQLANCHAADRVIIAGGDGTVSRLLPRLLHFSGGVGVFPLGTGNDLARELGTFQIAARPVEAWLEFYRGARTASLTVWEAHAPSYSQLFCSYLSCGFDALACLDYDRRRGAAKHARSSATPLWLRRAAYLRSAAVALGAPSLPELRVKFEQGEQCWSGLRALVFANIRSYMGLGWSNSQSDPFDGVLEAVPVRRCVDYLAMPAARAGLVSRPAGCAAGSFEIQGLGSAAPLQADGEALPPYSGGALGIRRAGVLKVLVA